MSLVFNLVVPDKQPYQKDPRIKSNQITWNQKRDKFILCKESVYFSLTKAQVYETNELTSSIITLIEKGEGRDDS